MTTDFQEKEAVRIWQEQRIERKFYFFHENNQKNIISSYNVVNIKLLLTEREGRTEEYWPEVVAVRTERSEVRTKTTEGPIFSSSARAS